MNILEEAKEITSGDRQEDYGMPEDSFRGIADYWTVYLDSHEICRRISPTDVAKMMILLKLAREDYKHKRDNLVDIAGYAHTLSRIEGDEDATPPPGTGVMDKKGLVGSDLYPTSVLSRQDRIGSYGFVQTSRTASGPPPASDITMGPSDDTPQVDYPIRFRETGRSVTHEPPPAQA